MPVFQESSPGCYANLIKRFISALSCCKLSSAALLRIFANEKYAVRLGRLRVLNLLFYVLLSSILLPCLPILELISY